MDKFQKIVSQVVTEKKDLDPEAIHLKRNLNLIKEEINLNRKVIIIIDLEVNILIKKLIKVIKNPDQIIEYPNKEIIQKKKVNHRLLL